MTIEKSYTLIPMAAVANCNGAENKKAGLLVEHWAEENFYRAHKEQCGN